jgi:hypothetical protein
MTTYRGGDQANNRDLSHVQDVLSHWVVSFESDLIVVADFHHAVRNFA